MKIRKILSIKEYKSKNVNKNKIVARKKRLKVFIFAVSIFIVVVINLSGYAIVSELKYDIHYLKEELNNEQISLENAQEKVNKYDANNNLEEQVKEKLNMDYPKENQIEYITRD